MSEHPITELMLAQKNATGHSLFGPSSAHRWFACPRSLIAGHLAGDTTSFYAAEGSVAHWLAEDWIKNGYPHQHIGSIRVHEGFEIEITEEMVSYVEEYVAWVSTAGGRHYVEVKVNLSEFTPVPSFGTADHIHAQGNLLTVTDLKYGKIVIRAEENKQGLCYALGAYQELDFLYDFKEVRFQICQPRREHFDEWVFPVSRLLDFGEELREAANRAWQTDAPYNPQPEACEYCNARITCPALAETMRRIAQDSFDDIEEITPNQALAMTQQEIVAGPQLPFIPEMPLDRLAQIYAWRPIVDKWFREAGEHLRHQLELGEEVPGFKLGRGRAGRRQWLDGRGAKEYLLAEGISLLDIVNESLVTPAQAAELLRTWKGGTKKANDQLIEGLVWRAPPKASLIPAKDTRPELPSAASAFDDLDDDI